MKIHVMFSIGWRVLLSLLLVVIGIGVYWIYNPLSINLQLIPYGSCRVKYKLFDKKVIVDKIIINKQKIYISPVAVPLTNERIPRIYIGDKSSYIIIKNLRPLAIKNSSIEIEAKNFDLYKVLKKPALKNMMLTTNTTLVLLDDKQFGLDVKHLLITNTPIGDVKTCFTFYRNNLDLVLDLPKYNHKLKCFGVVDINKQKKWDLKLIAQNTANIKKLKIRDVEYNADVKYNIDWRHGFKGEKLSLEIISDSTHINNLRAKNIDLGKVNINILYYQNKVNGILELLKFKHTVLCTGNVYTNNFLLDIKPKNPISIKNISFADKFIANGTIKYNLHAKRLNRQNNFTGNIDVTNCDIRNTKNNILMKNVIGKFKLNNNTLLLEKLEAELINFVKCKVNVNGKLNINTSDIDAQIKIHNGMLCNVPLVQSGFSVDVQVNGNIKKPLNTNGVIKLNNTLVDVTPIISSSMTGTEVAKNIIGKTSIKHTKLDEIVLPMNANIKLMIAPQMQINGTGLTSTWKGDGYFKSKANKPITWNIKLTAISGKYQMLKRKIKLSSGEMISNHQIPGYYKLTLTGKKNIDVNNMVGVRFTQYDGNTNIDFYSNVIRSKQDILSLFLFSKESSQLSTSEAYSLALLIQDIATKNENIFTEMNRLLRIDTFEIKHNEEKSDEYNTIVFGKKIGKWKLNFEQGKEIDKARFSVERKWQKHAKLGMSISKKDGLEGGISWSKRY